MDKIEMQEPIAAESGAETAVKDGGWARLGNRLTAPRGKNRMTTKKRGEHVFIALMLLFPICHFLLFYVAVNVNSLLLAFQSLDSSGSATFVGFKNFVKVWTDLGGDLTVNASLKNSAILYLIGLFVSTPLNILISFAIYKKIPMAGFFRIILFLPSIISGLVFVLIFKYFIDFGMPLIYNALGMDPSANLLIDKATAFGTLIFFGIWTGFGVGIILYSNAMTRIPASLVESGELDGMGNMQELWHLVLPMIFPTITTFLVTGVAGFFTAQGAAFSFFGTDAKDEISTLGYYLFVKVLGGAGDTGNRMEYPYAAAAGLLFTVIAAPITLAAKYLLEKFGPSAEY